ncbi:MAG: hypothetical protein QXM43_01680 [Desulfurococcaceae archaeon]
MKIINININFIIDFLFICIIICTAIYIIFLGITAPMVLGYYPETISAYEKTPLLVFLTWTSVIIVCLLRIKELLKCKITVKLILPAAQSSRHLLQTNQSAGGLES